MQRLGLGNNEDKNNKMDLKGIFPRLDYKNQDEQNKQNKDYVSYSNDAIQKIINFISCSNPLTCIQKYKYIQK